MTKTLQEFLKTMIEKGSSDLHIGAGTPPMIRVDGSLQPLSDDTLSAEQAQSICYEILSQEQIMKFEQDLELDFSFALKGAARFRGNLYWQQHTVVGAFRQIPFQVPSFAQLGLPQSVQDLAYKPHGLVLVTGTTGSGKSTTLAAMINAMNETKPWHIITVEDPIEFVFTPKKCLIHQREVGKDTMSFQNGLKYILREDPDVVMVGEMRDLETIKAAITIAETGHLVLATLHTNTAVQTIDRIIDVFPAHQQDQVRVQLSFVLQGILSQQLIPKVNGGRCLGLEILMPTPALRNLIRENKTHQLYAQMQMGQAESGMITMNQSLVKLIKDKVISKESALSHSPDAEELRKMV
ncbi:MAG: type IV pilus twitching motility protein PilT [Deltaproteobacteria bacterium]|nr:type IV pilus twitching motility protein PilT [Deltaproteobacteria bacterium]